MKNHYFPLAMKSSAAVSALLCILFIFLYRIQPAGWLLSIAITFGTVCYHFSMRLTVGSIVPVIMHRVNTNGKWFRSKEWEYAFYQKLGIKYWKRNLPTYAPQQFDLKSNTLSQVIFNSCQAELVHEVIMILSFLPLLFARWFGAFGVFAVTSVCAALYDSIFVIAQRYNRPRLVRIQRKKEDSAP